MQGECGLVAAVDTWPPATACGVAGLCAAFLDGFRVQEWRRFAGTKVQPGSQAAHAAAQTRDCMPNNPRAPLVVSDSCWAGAARPPC